MLDAADMAEKQDLTVAGRVIDEGRALVIAVNKTDLLADDRGEASKAWRKLTDRLEASFAQVKDVPIVGFSALNGRGVERLMPKVFETYDIWNKRVPTPKLNRWLREMETLHPPPLAKGRRIRLRFMTQIKIAAADLHAVGQPARRAGRRLPALPDQPPARRLRPAGRADPAQPCASRRTPTPAGPRSSDRQRRVAKVFYATIGRR